MNRHPNKREILFLAIMGTVFVPALALAFPSLITASVMALLAGGVVGWLAGLTKDLLAPPPDPEVPISIVQSIIGFLNGENVSTNAGGPPPVRWTVLGIGLMGCLMIFGLAFVFDGTTGVEIICGLAGTLLGAFASCMKDLISPPPGPAVPASVVEKILAELKIPAPADAAVAGGETLGLEHAT